MSAVESGAPIGGPISVHPVSKYNKEAENKIQKGFPPHAYWKVLDHESVRVDEPYNTTFKAPRAPTIPAEDALKVPIKYNFAETFDQAVWKGRMERPVVFASGIPKKNKYGSDMLENVELKSGCLDPKFIEKHNLSV